MSFKKPIKYVENELIMNSELYGASTEEDLAKNYLTNMNKVIKGEELMGIQKTNIGGIVITKESIARDIIEKFNERQKIHIENQTYLHKILCERKNEAVAMLFISLYDLVKEKADGSYKNMDRKELCYFIQNNIQVIVEEQLPWVVNYSKNIIKNYYSVGSNRLRIKLNYILDDGKYELTKPNEKIKGGLLLNGLLDELLFYSQELEPFLGEPIGFVCQVLCPSGLPRSKKWIQIDIGVSFIGKRLYQEYPADTLTRKSKLDVHLGVMPQVYMYPSNILYYNTTPDINYDGAEIHIWEILYQDQIFIYDEEELDYTFCKCKKRDSVILKHRNIIKKLNTPA